MAIENPIVALIDDDKIFQLTSSKFIKSTSITDRLLQFENAEDALKFLMSNINNASALPDFIFLDINMPLVDGWMFLDDYDKFKHTLPKPILIYMVSSSIDPRDINRAKNNSNIKDYVIKPVSREKFTELLGRVA
jgi:response regulator RpfG family c-di-GMP phosphodiesterase